MNLFCEARNKSNYTENAAIGMLELSGVRDHDKRDVFNFAIMNLPSLDSNKPTVPANGVYISQFMRYSRVCRLYSDFLQRQHLLFGKISKPSLKVFCHLRTDDERWQ